MKKILLPLILILLLTFTLTGFAADLFSTYDQRIKLTTDNTKIDSELTWFPVMARFGQLQVPSLCEKASRRPGMHAIYDSTADKTFIVFLGADTHPYITYYDHTTGLYGDIIRVGTSPDEDHHHYPMLLIDSSGYLWVFYGAHNLEPLRYAKSDNVRDISAWTDGELTNAAAAAYPFPVEDDGGDIYVFYRKHDTATHKPLYFVKTADGGSNWSAATVCIENTDDDDLEEVYLGKIAHESAHDAIPDRVHMIWTMAGGSVHDEFHEDIHYAYFKFSDDHFYAADDTDLGAVINDAELEANTKVVDTGAADDKDTPYINFVAYKANGNPMIVYGNDVAGGWYYNEYDSGWGTPVKLTNYTDYAIKDMIYEDSTIKALIRFNDIVSEYTSTNGVDFSNIALFDGSDMNSVQSEYVINPTSLIRIINIDYLAGYTNDSPILLYPGHNIQIFDELTADADFNEAAFTSSDEETQLYGDCAFFDSKLKMAIYHYSKTGWTLSSSAGTDSYFYYDGDASNNTTYISMSGGTAAQSVYDGDTKGAWNMQDDTTSTILDSTSNNNDGTKKGANEPIEVFGRVGKAQDFDGINDYITAEDSASLDFAAGFTLEVIAKPDSTDVSLRMLNRYDATSTDGYYLGQFDADSGYWRMSVYVATASAGVNSDSAPSGAFQHIVGVRDADGLLKIYIDGAVQAASNTLGGAIDSNGKLYLGSNYQGTHNFFAGIENVVRVSATARSAAWTKATYNSLFDSLLTYGSEELAGIIWNGIRIQKWNGITITIPLNTQ